MSGEIWHRYIDSVEGGYIDNIHGVRIVRYTFNWITIRVHMVNKIRCFRPYTLLVMYLNENNFMSSILNEAEL